MGGKEESDEKYYFTKIKDLLCKRSFVINIPYSLLYKFMRDNKYNSAVTAQEIVSSLSGEITINYIPAWQFCSWMENGIDYFLKYLHK